MTDLSDDADEPAVIQPADPGLVAGNGDPLLAPPEERMARMRDRPKRLSDWVVTELEERIFSGELSPGAVIPAEAELVDMLHVSRTVVRDALRTLSARGLVVVQRGRGTIVTEPSDGALSEALVRLLLRADLTLEDVLEARHILEAVLAPMAAQRSEPADWEAMAGILESYEEAIRQGNWTAAHKFHLHFHLAFLHSLHYPALEALLRPMNQVTLLSSSPNAVEDIALWDLTAHQGILTALSTRSLPALTQAVDDHYQAMQGADYVVHRAVPFRESPSVKNVLRQLLEGRFNSESKPQV